jgi:hypothetical protein
MRLPSKQIHSPALCELPLAHGAIAARRSAVTIPVWIPLTGLERFVADALDIIQAIQARVAARHDALLSGRLALATLAARGVALRSILGIVAVGVYVGIGGGFRMHLEKRTKKQSVVDRCDRERE